MSIKAISPLDGRYREQLTHLTQYFSEWALLKYRVKVEIEWLIHLSASKWIPEVNSFNQNEINYLHSIVENFNEEEALVIKEFESKTKHDVKAVEYYVKSKLKQSSSLKVFKEFVHFACTSEDINNISYALMLKGGVTNEWISAAEHMVSNVSRMAEQSRNVSMLSHTHGQPATPTTLGKELAVFVYRWQRQLQQIRNLEYLGKFNGAVGNFNSHVSAYPDAPWQEISKEFIRKLGLTYNPLTTQIEPHDYICECLQAITRFNNITLDFSRDMWSYISIGYFKQRVVEGEVGSSTMPHKVNPINFENSESNLSMSVAVLEFLSNKLPISRLQRDLSDSSALRNIGVGIAHSYIAIMSTIRGLHSLAINEEKIKKDLDGSWEVLGEAIQTVMRKNGYKNPYEKLKELTRGVTINEEEIKDFIEKLELPSVERNRLLAMRPSTYTGLAADLVKYI